MATQNMWQALGTQIHFKEKTLIFPVKMSMTFICLHPEPETDLGALNVSRNHWFILSNILVFIVYQNDGSSQEIESEKTLSHKWGFLTNMIPISLIS